MSLPKCDLNSHQRKLRQANFCQLLSINILLCINCVLLKEAPAEESEDPSYGNKLLCDLR